MTLLIISVIYAAETCGIRRLPGMAQRDLCPTILLARNLAFSRTYRAAKLWLIRGSRLLARFPAPNSRHDEKSLATRHALKRLPPGCRPQRPSQARQRSTLENKKGRLRGLFLEIKNKCQTVTPAPRSGHPAPPDAVTVILPDDYQPGLTEWAEADSATCRC
jgi:hypothetical protein